jgi:transcriptional regulator with XRE-family HTH domain
MPNAEKLKKLVDLRRACGKSQKEAALYFGLADSARNEISKWENGEKVPPPRYRERFIDYLCDFLNLGVDRERFNAIWTILSEEWSWDSPSAQELRKYFPPTAAAQVSEVTY